MIEAIVFLPLIGALISGIFTRKISAHNSQIITSSLVTISAILSIIIFYQVIFLKQIYSVTLLEWMNIGDLKINWCLKVDSLTAVMLIVVNIVSSLVHIYSIGYMHDDAHIQRFMSYLSLFTFSMLMLVTSNNLVQLFFGWEGVGLCSYLLIGFWYQKPEATSASMKAFIVNRVGDVAFILGIFAIFITFKSVEFDTIFLSAKEYQNITANLFGYELPILNTICILLFIGSMGKSAQIGLHTWLPDAMEGPTPVSALIHAATMVTAGVFLVARCSPLFEYAGVARDLVTIIGAITCIFAASIAITQNDIKRIIAYSTCSQLGYMFFACGISAYNGAIFHLMTHAFFKALLFLGAGSVIHAMNGEQDIRKMGDLRNKIPKTYIVMLIGSLALAGIFPFAGFYSKDIILEAAYASGTTIGRFAYYMGLLAALLTAFYSWRLLIMVFGGKAKYLPEQIHHIHESPVIMLLPLYILSFGAIGAGIVGVKFGIIDVSGDFWSNSIVMLEPNIIEKAHHVNILVKYSPLIAGILGIGFAYLFYQYRRDLPEFIVRKFKPLYNLSLNKYYIDEIYHIIFIKFAKKIGEIFWKLVDIKFIDDLGPNGSSKVSNNLSKALSKLQSGYLYHYAFIMLLGFIGIINWYILRNNY